MANPIVFLDIEIGGQPAGRVKLELFADECPKTSENFRQLCTGEYRPHGKPIGYKGCSFHKIVSQFMLQSGDFTNMDGTGVASIYGGSFPDESFQLKHSSAGLLSMANAGPNTNGSQFFITLAPAPFLDGKNCVFGRVIEGLATVNKMENVAVGPQNRPKIDVKIVECGEM